MFEIAIHIAIGLIVGLACGTLPQIIARWAANNDYSFIKRILGIKSPTKHMQGKEECKTPCAQCDNVVSGDKDKTSPECYFCHRPGCYPFTRWGFRLVPICDNCQKEIQK